MYKLLIVDDQIQVRNGLKKTVKWNDLGFSVVGDVECAKDALDFIQNNDVHVILTDIVMKDTNGLQLLDKVKVVKPQIKGIILSGYGEFEYAKEAVRLGVFYYLTKPVDFTELKKTFTEIKEILDKEQNEKEKIDNISESSRKRVLNNLCKGIYTTNEEIEKRLKRDNINLFIDSIYCVARVKLKKSNNKVQDYINEVLKANKFKYYFFENDVKEVVYIIYDDEEKTIMKLELQRLLNKLNMEENKIYIGIGNTYGGIMSLSASYKEAGEALEYCALKNVSCIKSYSEVVINSKQDISLISETTKGTIIGFLDKCDRKEMKLFIDNLYKGLCEDEKLNIDVVYSISVQIILLIVQYFNEHIDNSDVIIAELKLNIRYIYESKDFEEILSYMRQFIDKAFNVIASRRSTSSGLLIESVKKYIKDHYHENISLNNVAEEFYIHYTHLSRVFKEKTGEKFIDYVTKVRIEKSKQLLGDVTLKIYDISYKVGYDNPKYFSKIFKENVGMTPAEYREKLLC